MEFYYRIIEIRMIKKKKLALHSIEVPYTSYIFGAFEIINDMYHIIIIIYLHAKSVSTSCQTCFLTNIFVTFIFSKQNYSRD